MTIPPPPTRPPRCSRSSAVLRFHFHAETPAKKFKMLDPINIWWGGESVRTVARRVLIQICLVTAYDSCAGPPPPHQQACVKRKSSLDNQQLCSSACINLSYHRGDSGFFFQRVFDTGTVAFPSEVSHWLVAFIGTQDLRRGILSEGSAFCLAAKKNTCILSEFVEKGVVSWLLSAGLGKSFERLRYPLALLTSHLARGDARQTQEGLPAQRTLNSSVRALFTCQDVLLC